MLIYKITRLIDGKIYIGQTTSSLKKRIQSYKVDVFKFKKGKYKARSKIIAALAKYGFDEFQFDVLEEVSSQENLDSRERFWISYFNSIDRNIGFNIQLGGFGVGKHSLETRKIMSDKSKGREPSNKGKPGLSGEQVGNATLTQEQADSIREEYKIVKSSVILAEKYSVSKPTILGLLKNKTYKNPGDREISLPNDFWFVYLIQSLKNNHLYVGITIDVDNKIKTYNEGRGTSPFRGKNPFVLIRSFGPFSKSETLQIEYHIKQLFKEEKLNYSL